MKLRTYITFTVNISSPLSGAFMQEIYVKAENINKALEIANQYAENISGEVSKIQKSYYECIEASTKTITIEV